MSCTTKENVLILLELTLISSNYLCGELKYKSESGNKEIEFENYLKLLLTDGNEESEKDEEIVCR